MSLTRVGLQSSHVSLTYVFLICTVVPLLFGLWAQFKVKSTFKRYSQVPTASGMTGAQAAEAVLRNSGVTGRRASGRWPGSSQTTTTRARRR